MPRLPEAQPDDWHDLVTYNPNSWASAKAWLLRVPSTVAAIGFQEPKLVGKDVTVKEFLDVFPVFSTFF